MSASTSQPVKSQQKIRCLVIQLARLGDTLQSLMALRAAKQLYPNLEIHFVAREKFAAGAKRVPWLKSVITLPTDALLAPVLAGDKSETQALGDIARWIAPLVKEPWDFIVNWSYSEASSYLTGLLPGKIKLGYSRRKDTSFSAIDGWSHYIQAIVQGGGQQNIHLTDILTTQLLTALQIHVGEPSNDGDAPVTSKGFFSLELGDRELDKSWNQAGRKWVAIQLGAGHASKTWNAKSWAQVAAMVLRRHPEYNIVLLGGKEDESRAKQFMAALEGKIDSRENVLSLVGQTDFDLWASVVSRCQWLMAGDTAAIHLASVLGTRVLNVSVGPVRWRETGPYGNSHYVICSSLPCKACETASTVDPHSCKEDISPEAVYATWLYGTGEWIHRRNIAIEPHFAQLGWSDRLTKVQILRSRVRDTVDGGGVVYEPLIKRPLQFEDWLSMVMGHVARSWYCGWVPPVGQEVSREVISPQLIKQLRELQESSDVLIKIYDEARAASTELDRKSAKLRSDKIMKLADKSEIQAIAKKLMEIDQLAERVGKTTPPLLAFSQMSKVLMHNLQGSQLSELGKESAMSYQQLREGLILMRDWLKHTLGLAKPVAIKPGTAVREISP